MDCIRAREALWPPERPRLAEETCVAARRHVDGCSACRDYLRQDRLLLEYYQRLREVAAPRRLRERVFEVLARERAGAGSRWARPRAALHGLRRDALGWAAAVVVVAAAAGVSLVAIRGGGTAADDGTMFVEDYLRRAVREEHIQTSDPREVARFLTRELGLMLEPLRMPGLDLTGAEVCFLEGRRGAVVLYKKGGRVISHYVVPRAGGAATADPPRPVEARVRSTMPTVVTWAAEGLEHALVGDVPSSELMVMARATLEAW